MDNEISFPTLKQYRLKEIYYTVKYGRRILYFYRISRLKDIANELLCKPPFGGFEGGILYREGKARFEKIS